MGARRIDAGLGRPKKIVALHPHAIDGPHTDPGPGETIKTGFVIPLQYERKGQAAMLGWMQMTAPQSDHFLQGVLGRTPGVAEITVSARHDMETVGDDQHSISNSSVRFWQTSDLLGLRGSERAAR